MKLIKQIFIYIVFTVAIYGIFTVVTKDETVVNRAALSAGNHEQILKEIDQEWNVLSDWDEDTYNRHNTMIAQSRNAGIINEFDSKTLRDRINKTAYQKCVASMNREFSRSDCDASKLAVNYDGLQTILMNERGLAGNSQIIEVSKAYNLYQRIVAFNKKSFALNPRFDGNRDSWNSWTGHQEKITRQKNEFINNPIFQTRLKGITSISKIHDTNSRLDDARNNFYDNLSREIYSYFDTKVAEITTEEDIDSRKVKISELGNHVNKIRIMLANEKYLNKWHDIFNQLRDINHKINQL